MVNKLLFGVFTIAASWLASNFSFTKFEKQSFKVTSFQDTIKKDSVIIDSLSIEEGLYNYKLYRSRAEASYYANKFHGRRTASGEKYHKEKYTAAHRKFPFGTILRVTNLRNGKHLLVTVNDRGPHVRGREIDLSRAAFMKLAANKSGGAMIVKIEKAIKK